MIVKCYIILEIPRYFYGSSWWEIIHSRFKIIHTRVFDGFGTISRYTILKWFYKYDSREIKRITIIIKLWWKLINSLRNRKFEVFHMFLMIQKSIFDWI
jgi:hypothetical protein